MVLQKVLISLCFLLFTNAVFAADQIKFKTKLVSVGTKKINVWIADTESKRSHGMMFKTKWPEKIQGMLFVFEGENRRSFWMKNTFLPLSLGFFDSRRVLLETASMDPPKSLAQLRVDRVLSSNAAKYVLEVPKGWFKKEKIKAGAKLRLF